MLDTEWSASDNLCSIQSGQPVVTYERDKNRTNRRERTGSIQSLLNPEVKIKMSSFFSFSCTSSSPQSSDDPSSHLKGRATLFVAPHLLFLFVSCIAPTSVNNLSV